MEIALDSQTVNVSLSHTQLLIWFGGGLVTLFGAIWAAGIFFLNQINRRFADQQSQTNQRFVDQQSQTNQRFADQQKHADQRFADQMAYLDRRFADLRSYMDQRFEAVMSNMGEIKKDVREIRNFLMQSVQNAFESQGTSEAWASAPQPERRESPVPPSPERGNAPTAPDRTAAAPRQGEAAQSLSASGGDPEN